MTEPVTAIDTRQSLKIDTQNFGKDHGSHNTPYVVSYPETPLTAQPLSPAVAMEVRFPSTMTATPPLSAGPVEANEANEAKPFSFSAQDTSAATPVSASAASPRTLRRRVTVPVNCAGTTAPYMRNRSLHSILRNSPLPPATARTPVSPRRQSLRLQEKAARRVGYESPLESLIITSDYTKSPLTEEVSPGTPIVPEELAEMVLDTTMAYTADETRDGGQTPGPFEEMRRRMAGLVTRTPVSPSASGGIRKRKKKDRGRRWKWTIGKEEEEEDGDDEVGGALAALRAAARADSNHAPAAASTPLSITTSASLSVVVEEVPTPSIETFDEAMDVTMSETASEPPADRAWSLTPAMDIDLITPTAARKSMPADLGSSLGLQSWRQDSADMFNPETGSRRDTPVPADLMAT